MRTRCFRNVRMFALVVIFVRGHVPAPADEPGERYGTNVTRQVTFKLTFANRDLIWQGDPASPAALLYVRPGARPIAADVCVRAFIETRAPSFRHYMREARIAAADRPPLVHAFTKEREKVIGEIGEQGRFIPNDFYQRRRELLPTWPADASVLVYDPKENSLYYEVLAAGPRVSESLDFLPLDIDDAHGERIVGRYSIDYAAAREDGVENSPVVALTIHGQKPVILAEAALPGVFRRQDVQIGSFDNSSGTYLPEAAYRSDAKEFSGTEPSVTVWLVGEFTSVIQSDGEALILREAPWVAERRKLPPAKIAIDGNFDDWRNVLGVDDPRGDVAPYLEYVPDVDILEFKVAHDDEHIYLYARVAGQVGRTHPDGGRSYFYAYMDVDRNPNTGFLPSRDDECYFGVDIGDDCEVQFEFVNNVFRKSFYGFCGLGGNENVLRQQLTLGESQYGRFDERGLPRANYKCEYIFRDGKTAITEDLKLGTSDTIRLAVSPDGSEVEVASTYTGFLKDAQGRPTISLGQAIDIALGMESDSRLYPGKTGWGADNTVPIRGYLLDPASP